MFKMFVLHSMSIDFREVLKIVLLEPKKCKIMCGRLKESGVYNT